jgi:hypothetical protein
VSIERAHAVKDGAIKVPRRCWAGHGNGGCGGGAARPGVHIVLGMNVGTLLGEALNRSNLLTEHPVVERSQPLHAGGMKIRGGVVSGVAVVGLGDVGT